MKKFFLILFLLISLNKTYAQTDSFQVYPNPFSSFAYMHFYLVQADTISINLYNAIGAKIGTNYQDTFFVAGPHTVSFMGDSLANGVYFLKLVIGKSNNLSAKIIKSGPTSTNRNEPAYKIDILLFPNPASDDVNIEINNFHDKSIRLNIYDNAGRLVFSENYSGNNFEIATADFESGIYTINIPDLNYNYKLILIK